MEEQNKRYHLRIRVWKGIEDAVDTKDKRTQITDSGIVITPVSVGNERYILVTISSLTTQALTDLDAILFRADKRYCSIADIGLLYSLLTSKEMSETKDPRDILRQYSRSADVGSEILIKLPYATPKTQDKAREGFRSYGFEVVDERPCRMKTCSYRLNRVPLEETLAEP